MSVKELNIGDYVRTENGNIGKITLFEGDLVRVDTDKFITYKSFHDEIIKSSPNIIDLIQEGDYVNGDLVYYRPDSNCDEKRQVRNIDMCGMVEYIPITSLYKIKSIVTKEQFESMKYKV